MRIYGKVLRVSTAYSRDSIVIGYYSCWGGILQLLRRDITAAERRDITAAERRDITAVERRDITAAERRDITAAEEGIAAAQLYR